jgi:rubrerythrin
MKNLSKLTLLLAGSLVAAVVAQAAPDKTIVNLNAAFRGESNASHRYEAFAKKADAEGFAQVAKLFRAASKAEAIHRDAHKDAITKLGGKADEFALDEVKSGSTKENLAAAIKGETYERDVMYPDFLKQAQADQATAAVRTMRFALAAETEHAKLYQAALDDLGKNPAADFYVCPVCGYTVASLPGRACPVCSTSKEKFLKFN